MKPLVLVVLLLSSPVAAQDLSGFEKILFPVLSTNAVHGAYGSTFETRLDAAATQNVAFYPAATDGAAPAIDVLHGSPSLLSNGLRFWDPMGVSHGRLLFFDRAAVAGVAFGYELKSQGIGVPEDVTQLPVVRERDFRTGTTYVLNMPVTPVLFHGGVNPPPLIGFAERNTLRIYDVDNRGSLEADVIFHPIGMSATFAGPHIRADRRDADDVSFPYYGEVTFIGPCITISGACWQHRSTVEIRPTDPTTRYWAFLSTTDNTSQYVTIRTAQ